MQPGKSLTMRCTTLLASCEVRPQFSVQLAVTTAQHPSMSFRIQVKCEAWVVSAHVRKPKSLFILPAGIYCLYEAAWYHFTTLQLDAPSA